MSQVVALLQFILVIPSTNATSARSFCALQHLKSYLRTMTLQERLNYLMSLHFDKKEEYRHSGHATYASSVGRIHWRVGASMRHLCSVYLSRIIVKPSVVVYNRTVITVISGVLTNVISFIAGCVGGN